MAGARDGAPDDRTTPEHTENDPGSPEQTGTGLGSGTASGLGHSHTSEPEPVLGDEADGEDTDAATGKPDPATS